jgi:hypothetical protein
LAILAWRNIVDGDDDFGYWACDLSRHLQISRKSPVMAEFSPLNFPSQFNVPLSRGVSRGDISVDYHVAGMDLVGDCIPNNVDIAWTR